MRNNQYLTLVRPLERRYAQERNKEPKNKKDVFEKHAKSDFGSRFIWKILIRNKQNNKSDMIQNKQTSKQTNSEIFFSPIAEARETHPRMDKAISGSFRG